MAKADVLDLVQTLSAGQADPTLADAFYREAVLDLATRPLLIGATLATSLRGTHLYTLPDSSISVLAMFYDDTQLSFASLVEVETDDLAWRDAIGSPVVWLFEDESARRFLLYPRPDADSKDFVFLFGSPFGHDFPAMAVAIVATEAPDDVPVYLELPVALFVLAREFSRESPHRDERFARVCQDFAEALLAAVST